MSATARGAEVFVGRLVVTSTYRSGSAAGSRA